MAPMTEGLEVRIDGKPAYAVLPPTAQRGVVVIHEVLGRQPEIDRVAHRFADAGYAAVAPDLFSDGPRAVCIARAIRATQTGKGPQIEQLRRARQWLCGRTGIEPRAVGVIGFCLGGGFALAAGSGWGAHSTNYGDIPSADVMRGIGPVIGCYGGRDRVFGKHARKLEARLRPLGVPVETHTFPEVGHSFLTDGEHPVLNALSRSILQIAYDPQTAEEGWRRILEFFDRHL
jgi:carboxymethylenebutenolidase